jgi:hypothetical protein
MTTNLENINRLRQKLDQWRTDPVLYAREVIGVEPESNQAEILRAFAQPGAKVTVKAGHGVGKTAVASWAALWFVPLFPDCKVGATAPSAQQLHDVLMAEIAKWHGRMNPWFRNQLVVTGKSLHVKGAEKTQFLTARTARPESPDALQGLHATNMAFIIEESFGVADSIYEVARGALTTKGARALLIGNPTATSGYAYNTFHRNAHMWRRFTLSCTNSKLADQNYVEEMRQEWGEDSDVYRVRVLGEFPQSSINQLIPRTLVETAMNRKLARHEYEFAPVVLGVDPAWEGDDRSVVVMRQGLASKCLGVFAKMDSQTLGDLVNQWWTQYKAAACFIDIGWGSGVIDYLRRLGRNPMPVNFGGASSSPMYHNKRTQMWFDMLQWLESGGTLWPASQGSETRGADAVVTDLTAPQCFILPNGKKALESKKDMKRRGLRSPDIGDALALTFAAPVHIQQDITRSGPIKQRPSNRLETEYDVFKALDGPGI